MPQEKKDEVLERPPVKCNLCGGTGKLTCAACRGTGTEPSNPKSGEFKGYVPCHGCNGNRVVNCPRGY